MKEILGRARVTSRSNVDEDHSKLSHFSRVAGRSLVHLQVRSLCITDQVTSFTVNFFTSFDTFQCQRWFHSNQMDDFPDMSICPCGMLCPRCIRSHAQRLVHSPMIADLAVAEQFPHPIAEPNKQNTISSQPCGFHM